jgi:Protein of unknown function (DUF2442)
MMLKDIVAVKALEDFKLDLQFEDGISGVVNLKELIQFTGVFAPLLDPAYFAQVRVDPDLGTVCWENGADLDPLVLYAHVTGQAITLKQPQLF